MLSFHCKQTDAAVFRKPLERYLVDLENTKSGGKSSKPKKQVLAAFDSDIVALEQARNNIRNAPPTPEDGQSALLRYYFVLDMAESKIPFNETEVRVPITWYDSVHKGKKTTSYNLGLDFASVLFNHAAFSSQIGASTDRSSIDGLKLSCKHFQCAAGALARCREVVSERALGPVTVDMSVEALAMMEAAMLAQAHHCLCEKAKADGIKDAVLSKLCQGTVDLFSRAHAQFSNQQIRSNYNKTWSGLLEMHIHHYRAKAHHHQSVVAKDADEPGTQISHLRLALGSIQKAKELARVANAAHIVQGFLSELEATITQTLVVVEKDNSLIYNSPIPNPASLPPIEGKVMVKPTPVSDWLVEPKECPKVFAGLLPAAAAAALSDHRTKLEEMQKKQFELATTESNTARGVLAELNLGGLLGDDEDGKLPLATQEQITSVQKAGGYSHLVSTMQQVTAMSQENGSLVQQLKAALDGEEQQDRDMRAQFPNMNTQITESSKINSQLRLLQNNLQQKYDAASSADSKVRAKLESHKAAIEMLDLGLDQLTAKCPRPGKNLDNKEAANSLNLVKEANNKLKIVLERRDNLKKKLNESIEKDDAENLLLRARPPYTEAFKEAMAKHEAIVAELKENISQQEAHLAVLLEHTGKARAGQDEAAKSRDAYLSAISVGANAHREISENLKEGLEWHTKFQDALKQHLQRFSDFAMSRRLEKQMFAESLSQTFATMTVDAIPAGPYN